MYIAKTTKVNSTVFEQLINDATSNSGWNTNTIYIKDTKEKIADPNKIKSEYTYLDEAAVKALSLHEGISNGSDSNGGSDAMTLNNCKIVKYEDGGFMKRHADTKHDKEMAGRLIFIPPACISSHKGGTLILYTRPSTYVNQDREQWTIVYLPYGTPHEVTTVSHGTRYSIVCDVSVAGLDDFTLSRLAPEAEGEPESSEEEEDVGPVDDWF